MTQQLYKCCTNSQSTQCVPCFDTWHMSPVSAFLPGRLYLEDAWSPFQDLPSFDAISYVWGYPKFNCKISCNGKIAKITASLRDALVRLRDSAETRILWADALCINQNDLDERQQQVKLMGLIYWKARHVHVWLGHENPMTESCSAAHAVYLMKKLGNHLIDADSTDSSTPNIKLYGIDSAIADGRVFDWQALSFLLRIPWFQRVWVVQELGLSREATFYCGETSFSRDVLDSAVSFFESRGSTIMYQYGFNLQMLQLTNRYQRSIWGDTRFELGSDPDMAETFLDILESARGLGCTDRRDGIYAFLGHPAAFKQHPLDGAPYQWYPQNYYDTREPIIQPNYQESNSWEKLYVDFAATMIEDRGLGLQLLRHVAHDECLNTAMSSWIPIWYQCCEPSLFVSQNLYYAASNGLPSTQLRIIRPKGSSETHPQLQLHARRLGSIDLCEDAAYPIAHIIEMFAANPESYGEQFWSQKRTNEEIPEDLVNVAMTLTAGLTIDSDLVTKPAEEHRERHIENFREYVRREQVNEEASIDYPRERNDEAVFYDDALQRLSWHRSLFRSRDGQFGLGPRIMKPGDEIWLPMGATMPFIFRPLGDSSFNILGQAYVHGIMRGEAVQGLTENDFEKVILC
ncbi:hypothetical protein IQ07DRAFT_633530 [Pyrenochaeta sp. DS3sAY3a]|nr:hypothetical protein IQ07DRAFT_633530 [Pyrenochaeta sp. DS3sAY3a]